MGVLGMNIRKRREELGMTQQELADKLGYSSKSTINKIENGTNDITQSKIKAFAKALNTTVPELMGWGDGVVKESSSQYCLFGLFCYIFLNFINSLTLKCQHKIKLKYFYNFCQNILDF